MTNVELYGGLAIVSEKLLNRQLRFVEQCQRARGADQPIKHLLLWDHSNLSWSTCSKGAGARPNYAKRLLNECSSVVRNDDELRKLMLNDVEWKKRIPGFIRENYN